MCGIYGIATLSRSVDIGDLARRAHRMAHRGPDDAGEWISEDGRVGLSHRRLAILDLSEGGHQPMTVAGGRVAIVYNGEIYNYRQLRIELEDQGFGFSSAGDAEVILNAYLAWGDRCVERLNGMFAFAICDSREQGAASIFIARDRVGEKPLYYCMDRERFQFASELKALHLTGGLDADALNFYLALGYVPADMCFASGATKLPAGTAGRLSLGPFRLETWKYWTLPRFAPRNVLSGTELIQHTEELLEDSVRIRLQSDVPLGVLLSGGVDSSVITALAARNSTQRIRTYTLALPGSDLDEASYAAAVANHLGTVHSVLELSSPASDLLDELRPQIDEPIADSSIIPMYGIAKLTRQHVTVALGGDGGDEVFGGYGHYRQTMRNMERLRWLPAPILELAATAAAALPTGVKGRNMIASFRGGILEQSVWSTPYFDVPSRARLLGPEVSRSLRFGLTGPEQWRLGLMKGASPVDAMMRMDFQSTLAEGYLAKVDRASMAVSLEVRCPMLDHRLVELYFSRVLCRDRVTSDETRVAERALARKLLPPSVSIKRKQGFSIPLDKWMKEAKCEMMGDYRSFLPAIVERREVDALESGLIRGRANGSRLFSLLMLSIACRNLSFA